MNLYEHGEVMENVLEHKKYIKNYNLNGVGTLLLACHLYTEMSVFD